MKKGMEPAYPNKSFVGSSVSQNGMSKRFYAACAAAQGLLSANKSEIMMLDCESTIRYAYKYADELIKQENDGQVS